MHINFHASEELTNNKLTVLIICPQPNFLQKRSEHTNTDNGRKKRISRIHRYVHRFLSYSIKPILGIYETITTRASFVDRDRPGCCRPGWKNEASLYWDRGPAQGTARKEIKILSRAADHHSRFGREPTERFLPFFFSLSLFLPFVVPSGVSTDLSREKHRGFACDQLPIKPGRIGSYLAPNRWPIQQQRSDTESREHAVSRVARFIETAWN